MGAGVTLSDAGSSALDGGWSQQAMPPMGMGMGMYAPMAMAHGFMPGAADYYGQPTAVTEAPPQGQGQQQHQRRGRHEQDGNGAEGAPQHLRGNAGSSNRQQAAAAAAAMQQQQAYMGMAGYPTMYAGHNPMYGHQQPAGYPGYGYGYGFPPGGVPFKAAGAPYGGYLPGAQQPGSLPQQYAQHTEKSEEHGKPQHGSKQRGGSGYGGGATDHHHHQQQQQQQYQQQYQQHQQQGGFLAAGAGQQQAPAGLDGYGLPSGGDHGPHGSLYGGARDPQDGGYGGYGQQRSHQGWQS